MNPHSGKLSQKSINKEHKAHKIFHEEHNVLKVKEFFFVNFVFS